MEGDVRDYVLYGYHLCHAELRLVNGCVAKIFCQSSSVVFDSDKI